MIFVIFGDFGGVFEKMIVVFVIVCLCVLGFVMFIFIMVGLGRLVEYGILFKGGEYLEVMYWLDMVILDKMGIVINGKLVLIDVIVVDGFNENELFRLVGVVERNFEYLFVEVIVEGIKEKKIDILSLEMFEVILGFGIELVVEGKYLLIGICRLMKKFNIDIEEVFKLMEVLEWEGKIVMFIVIDKEYVGIVVVVDIVKDILKVVIVRLKKMGLDVVMIIGDNI